MYVEPTPPLLDSVQKSIGHDSAITAFLRWFLQVDFRWLAVKRSRCYLANMPKIDHLECSRCHEKTSAEKPQTVCPKCAGAFYVRYDLAGLHGHAKREQILRDATADAWAGMWRYRSVLPEVQPVTLGEGWTPVIRSKRFRNAYLKEEGANPTGSFKARGLALAGNDGAALWVEETGGAIGGERCGGTGGLCGGGGNRSKHFHAERCAVCELCGSEIVWSEGHAG